MSARFSVQSHAAEWDRVKICAEAAITSKDHALFFCATLRAASIFATALGVPSTAFCFRSLQRGDAEKCKTGRTIDLPALRHGPGIGRWCSQPTSLCCPQRHRQKTKARHLGLDTSEGVLGPSFFHSESGIRGARSQKSRLTAVNCDLSDWPSPARKTGDGVKI